MPLFQAGIHILAKLMNKEIEYYEYITYSSCILYLLPFLSNVWLPRRYHSDSVSPFTFSWTNICKKAFLSLCCPFSPISCVLAWTFAHGNVWLSYVEFDLLLYTLPRKIVLHLTTEKFVINFFSSIEKNAILWNWIFFSTGIKLPTSSNFSKICLSYF